MTSNDATTQPPYYEVFDVERRLGVPKSELISFLVPTFSVLHLDRYDAKRKKVEYLMKVFPDSTRRLLDFLVHYYGDDADLGDVFDLIADLSPSDLREFDRIGAAGRRKRAIAKFIVSDHGGKGGEAWEVKRVQANAFTQAVGADDVRSLERRFYELRPFVASNPHVLAVIRGIADMVREQRPNCEILRMSMHQMFIFADLMSSGSNAPEGVHQDGADYIVSALVIDRAGITGGESIVYAPDRSTQLLRCTLQPGEGLFQDDRTLWHDVTSIHEDPSVEPAYGHRSIIGFDIDVLA